MIEEKEIKEGLTVSISEKKIAKAIIDAIDAIGNDTGTFQITEKGARIEVLSFDKTALASIALPRYYFPNTPEGIYSVSLEKEKEKLILVLSKSQDEYFLEDKLKLINSAMLSINAREFNVMIKGIKTALSIPRASIKIKIGKEYVTLTSLGDTKEITIKYRAFYDSSERVEREGLYDLDALTKMIAISKYSNSYDVLNIEIAESKILRLSYNIEDISIRYYLAPLIER